MFTEEVKNCCQNIYSRSAAKVSITQSCLNSNPCCLQGPPYLNIKCCCKKQPTKPPTFKLPLCLCFISNYNFCACQWPSLKQIGTNSICCNWVNINCSSNWGQIKQFSSKYWRQYHKCIPMQRCSVIVADIPQMVEIMPLQLMSPSTTVYIAP